jgi:hypothetical protein
MRPQDRARSGKWIQLQLGRAVRTRASDVAGCYFCFACGCCSASATQSAFLLERTRCILALKRLENDRINRSQPCLSHTRCWTTSIAIGCRSPRLSAMARARRTSYFTRPRVHTSKQKLFLVALSGRAYHQTIEYSSRGIGINNALRLCNGRFNFDSWALSRCSAPLEKAYAWCYA